MFYHIQHIQKAVKSQSCTFSGTSPLSFIQWMTQKLQSLYGMKKFLQEAARTDALHYLQSHLITEQLEGLRRLLHLPEIPFQSLAEKEKFSLLKEELAQQTARQKIEQELQEKVHQYYQKRYQADLQEIQLKILKDLKPHTETTATLCKLWELEKMKAVHLPMSAPEYLRPQSPEDIIGQKDAVQALICHLSSPYPQHLLLYGPPGVGKTSSARLALKIAGQSSSSFFRPDAPFVEADGTSLHYDPREAVNPLLGSVHDPIFQGASRDLAAESIPEPKPGLVSQAHGGILFMDEIGALEPSLQNQLLKVLEDKRVSFQSSYYDAHNPQIPLYIRQLFEQGIPADFILIGATTSAPESISPALRSRCTEIFFRPLSSGQILKILKNSAEKLQVHCSPSVLDIISQCCQDARSANKILADAYSMAFHRAESSHKTSKPLILTAEDIKTVLQWGKITPVYHPVPDFPAKVGQITGLTTTSYTGHLLSIECAAFPAAAPGQGIIRCNSTTGNMMQDSIWNARTALKNLCLMPPDDYDLHLNFIGGGRVDGTSAGGALALAMLSALNQLPLRQDTAITGEISLHGELYPVGGIGHKIAAAQEAGLKKVLIPAANFYPGITTGESLEIIPIQHLEEAFPHLFADRNYIQKLLR